MVEIQKTIWKKRLRAFVLVVLLGKQKLLSVRHLEYLAKLFPDLPRSCIFWQDLRRIPRKNPKSYQDIQDEIQDLVKISKMKSKIFKNSRFSWDLGKIFLRYSRYQTLGRLWRFLKMAKPKILMASKSYETKVSSAFHKPFRCIFSFN